jgi:hypothetical protein
MERQTKSILQRGIQDYRLIFISETILRQINFSNMSRLLLANSLSVTLFSQIEFQQKSAKKLKKN